MANVVVVVVVIDCFKYIKDFQAEQYLDSDEKLSNAHYLLISTGIALHQSAIK